MHYNYCRGCLSKTDNYTSFSCGQNSVKYKMRLCVPEIDLKIISDSVLCSCCKIKLDQAYEFKLKCLEVEDRILEYVKVVQPETLHIKLEYVLQMIGKNSSDAEVNLTDVELNSTIAEVNASNMTVNPTNIEVNPTNMKVNIMNAEVNPKNPEVNPKDNEWAIEVSDSEEDEAVNKKNERMLNDAVTNLQVAQNPRSDKETASVLSFNVLQDTAVSRKPVIKLLTAKDLLNKEAMSDIVSPVIESELVRLPTVTNTEHFQIVTKALPSTRTVILNNFLDRNALSTTATLNTSCGYEKGRRGYCFGHEKGEEQFIGCDQEGNDCFKIDIDMEEEETHVEFLIHQELDQQGEKFESARGLGDNLGEDDSACVDKTYSEANDDDNDSDCEIIDEDTTKDSLKNIQAPGLSAAAHLDTTGLPAPLPQQLFRPEAKETFRIQCQEVFGNVDELLSHACGEKEKNDCKHFGIDSAATLETAESCTSSASTKLNRSHLSEQKVSTTRKNLLKPGIKKTFLCITCDAVFPNVDQLLNHVCNTPKSSYKEVVYNRLFSKVAKTNNLPYLTDTNSSKPNILSKRQTADCMRETSIAKQAHKKL